MIPGIFVTGTGTGVGKTVVTAGLTRHLLWKGLRVVAAKPVQTGAETKADGTRTAPDLEWVWRAAGLPPDPRTEARACPWRLLAPCSPHLAARLEATEISLQSIISAMEWLGPGHDALVVEGAGGLLVPLNDEETMLDLIRALHMPVALVGPAGLGAINQVLLSLEALRHRALPIWGVVLNATEPETEEDRFIREDNVATIEAFGRVRVRARIPYLGATPCLTPLDAALIECGGLREMER